MKLELAPDALSKTLREELDFEGYLSLFDLDLPMLPHRFVTPLDQPSAESHFQRLAHLKQSIDQHQLDLAGIMAALQEIPDLDFIWPGFANRHLQQPHLFALGRFVHRESAIQHLECQAPVETGYNPEVKDTCKMVLNILGDVLAENYGELLLDVTARHCLKDLDHLQAQIGEALSTYEKDILDQTGLKMIYPYPKELVLPHENLESFQASPLLQVNLNEAVCRIGYRLPEGLKTLLARKDTLDKRFEALMQEHLIQINRLLHPFYPALREMFLKRRQIAYLYALLWVQKNRHLALPALQHDIGITAQAAELPVLKTQKGAAYVPLTITLTQGASVLFGANMNGKTTVLKTLYFQVSLARFGLPVPAKALRLHFPKAAALHLKSSGDLRQGMSGFGMELTFLSQTYPPGALILLDELLQSTDPINGNYLAQLFLDHFAQHPLVFVCTSHYPQLTRRENIAVFTMKDRSGVPPHPSEPNEQFTGSTYEPELKRCPAEVELNRELQKPLQLALAFPLPEKIKRILRERLKGNSPYV